MQNGAFSRGAKSITLDGVPAFPGPAPNERLGVVDTQVFAEQSPAATQPVTVSGDDILLMILKNQVIRARCVSVEENVYERSFRLEELEYARLVSYNSDLPARKFSGIRSRLAFQDALSIGSKIFVNGGMGVVIGSGTRHSPEAPSLSFSVDIFGMDPSYVDAGTNSRALPLTIGIPLPVTTDAVMESVRAYVQELGRTGYEHSRNEMTITERIKSSIQRGDLLLTDSHYPVFAGPQPDSTRKV